MRQFTSVSSLLVDIFSRTGFPLRLVDRLDALRARGVLRAPR